MSSFKLAVTVWKMELLSVSHSTVVLVIRVEICFTLGLFKNPWFIIPRPRANSAVVLDHENLELRESKHFFIPLNLAVTF